jgi:hypothetical protein
MNLNFIIDMTTEVLSNEVSLSRKNVADVFVPKQIAWVSTIASLEDVLRVDLGSHSFVICVGVKGELDTFRACNGLNNEQMLGHNRRS